MLLRQIIIPGFPLLDWRLNFGIDGNIWISFLFQMFLNFMFFFSLLCFELESCHVFLSILVFAVDVLQALIFSIWNELYVYFGTNVKFATFFSFVNSILKLGWLCYDAFSKLASRFASRSDSSELQTKWILIFDLRMEFGIAIKTSSALGPFMHLLRISRSVAMNNLLLPAPLQPIF